MASPKRNFKWEVYKAADKLMDKKFREQRDASLEEAVRAVLLCIFYGIILFGFVFKDCS